MAEAATLDETQAYSQALAAYRAGQFGHAEKLCRRAIAANRDYFDAVHLLAAVHMALGNNDLALASFARALAIRPDHSEALTNRGIALKRLKRREEALSSFDRALTIQPDDARAQFNHAVTLHELKRHDEALAGYDRALRAQPNNFELHNNRGVALHDMQRFDEALASYERALAVKSDYAEAHNNRGVTLNSLKRNPEALANYDRAIAVRPNYAEAHNNRGSVLREMGRYEDALASYNRAVAAQPDYANALNNRGIALCQLDRLDEALASYQRAVAARPDFADALDNRGNLLVTLGRLDEALASYEQVLATSPTDSRAFSGAANCVARQCDWKRRTELSELLRRHVMDSGGYVTPFVLLGYTDDPALKLDSARHYIANKIPTQPKPLWTGKVWRHDKIRVAYIAADLRSHALGHLIADLLESHNRSRFDIVGISYGLDDGSDIRKRIVAAFDTFHDVREMDDAEVAQFMYELGIDVAVDLQSYSGAERPGILAHRPAPIHVNYIGYPGTMGGPFVDYVMVDKIVAPFEHQQFFTEKIVHLPDCYLPFDRNRRVSPRFPTRQESGLPEHGFVFCCFNNNWKITPAIFDIWMWLLHEVEDSVLWLLRDNEGAERNLRAEAAARGIRSSRLVFADRMPSELHLARHQLADLFLDTLPYNAHSTAADALRVGTPIVTCIGTFFPGRVSASHLHALGFPELVVSNLDDYRALALKLARDPALLASIRGKLLRHRDTYPLFDTERLTRGVETAYRTMWEIWQRGEAPRSFTVEPPGKRIRTISADASP